MHTATLQVTKLGESLVDLGFGVCTCAQSIVCLNVQPKGHCIAHGVTHLEFWTSKRRMHLLKLTKEHIIQAQLLSNVFAYA